MIAVRASDGKEPELSILQAPPFGPVASPLTDVVPKLAGPTEAWIRNYKQVIELPEGRILLRPLPFSLTGQATELLTQVFGLESMKFPEKYLGFLRKEVRAYLDRRRDAAPHSMVLVCIFMKREALEAQGGDESAHAAPTAPGPAPGDRADGGPTTSPSPAAAVDESVRVVGVCEVVDRHGPRTGYITLNPPKSAAFFLNLVVHPDFRRKGLARAMTLACARIAVAQGETEMYLHNR